MNIEDCFKKELLIRKKPAREKAKQSLKAAKVYIKKAKDNIALKNYDITIVAAYTSMFHSLRSILFKDGLKRGAISVYWFILSMHIQSFQELQIVWMFIGDSDILPYMD